MTDLQVSYADTPQRPDTVVEALDVMWRDACQPGARDRTPEDIYFMILTMFDQCRTRREEVEERDPWRQGALLIWAEDNWEELTARGFIPAGQSFGSWATEHTGVAYKTWMAWRRVVRVFMHTTTGKAYLTKAGLTTETAPETIRMDKAIRATKAIARGTLEQHQLDVLVDPERTVDELRHAMVKTATEWTQDQKEFITNGSNTASVVFDTDTQKVLLYAPGESQPREVMTFVRSVDPMVKELQDEALAAIGAQIR